MATKAIDEVQPMTFKEGLALKEKLDIFMDQLEAGDIQGIYFGEYRRELDGQSVYVMRRILTVGGDRYAIHSRDEQGRTGSGTYYQISPEGRQEVVADMVDRALSKLYALRLQKARFPSITRLQALRESDLTFCAL